MNTYEPSVTDLTKWPCRRPGPCANHDHGPVELNESMDRHPAGKGRKPVTGDTIYKALPTLIRELREAAYEAGVAAGLSEGTRDREAANRRYRDAQRAVSNRLDQLGLR